MICELEDKIFAVQPANFEELAIQIFQFQYAHNPVYRSFADAIGTNAAAVGRLSDIPFLPISFFKSHEVTAGLFDAETIFESSGTAATGNSRHFVKSLDLYRKSFVQGFEHFYGFPANWCIVGLLPSYLERQHSSLVVMVHELITMSGHPDSRFCLYEYETLAELLKKNEALGQPTLLIGVTYALLDFAETFSFPLRNIVVMETGGMKGRKKEITREEVHEHLQAAWQLDHVHSEYGMTELLSQAYSKGEGLFRCPAWMKVVLREEDDPLSVKVATASPQTGLLNVVDLANFYSCPFVATDDLCRLHPDGSFEVLGRMDSSDVRGCSLMFA